jgi:hypothetical protein
MADETADPVIRGNRMDPPETRYAKSGDVHIAYQVVGSGALDLVFAAGFVSKSVECTKLKAILDFDNEIEQPPICAAVDSFNHFCETIWRPFQFPPFKTSWPIFARSRQAAPFERRQPVQ